MDLRRRRGEGVRLFAGVRRLSNDMPDYLTRFARTFHSMNEHNGSGNTQLLSQMFHLWGGRRARPCKGLATCTCLEAHQGVPTWPKFLDLFTDDAYQKGHVVLE
jgi:hypothetical protein